MKRWSILMILLGCGGTVAVQPPVPTEAGAPVDAAPTDDVFACGHTLASGEVCGQSCECASDCCVKLSIRPNTCEPSPPSGLACLP